jgi:glycosyltransferase involved in cell wall biosynthesis
MDRMQLTADSMTDLKQAAAQTARASVDAAQPARLPHICFVAPLAWPILSGDRTIPLVGGAEVQQCILALLLQRAGYRVSMICLDFGQPDQVVVDGVTVYRAFRLDAGVPLLRFFHPRISSIWQAMQRADADVYYQRSAAMFTAVVASFCRRHGRRSIYAGASDSDFIPGHQEIQWWRDRKLFEFGLARVDAVVVQNEQQQQFCLRHYGRPSRLIPSSYSLPAGARCGGGDLVLWVATLHPKKRPAFFVELARRLPQYHFVMIGGPSKEPGGAACHAQVRQQAAGLSNLDLLGFLPLAETETYFDRARVLVNTSDAEGMPNVFLQAWARGIPSLAFIDVGARQNGQPVYTVVDDIEQAARAIEQLFTDEQAWQQAGERVQAYFTATYADQAILQDFRALLASLGLGEAR